MALGPLPRALPADDRARREALFEALAIACRDIAGEPSNLKGAIVVVDPFSREIIAISAIRPGQTSPPEYRRTT